MTNAMFLFISPGAGSDAGGVSIVVTPSGVEIVKVPGWEPRVAAEIFGALQVMQVAGAIENPEVREQFEHLAERTIQGRRDELMAYARQLG